MSNVACPRCGSSVAVRMTSPDYGYPQHGGAGFRCYGCDVYGFPFTSQSPEALAESNASRETSRANAKLLSDACGRCGDLTDHGRNDLR